MSDFVFVKATALAAILASIRALLTSVAGAGRGKAKILANFFCNSMDLLDLENYQTQPSRFGMLFKVFFLPSFFGVLLVLRLAKTYADFLPTLAYFGLIQ